VTLATLVAKLTPAATTPGTRRRAPSMAATQEAQEIPPTGMPRVSAAGVKPAARIAARMAAGSTAAGS